MVFQICCFCVAWQPPLGVGVCERRHRASLVNRGGWWALAAVHPYYDRPPCRAPACLPASSDSSVGGSGAASTARSPHHGWEVGCCWAGGLNPDVWNNVDGGRKCKWGSGGGVFVGWGDGAKTGHGPELGDDGHAGKIRVNSGADEYTLIFSIFLGQLHPHRTGRQQLCRIGGCVLVVRETGIATKQGCIGSWKRCMGRKGWCICSCSRLCIGGGGLPEQTAWSEGSWRVKLTLATPPITLYTPPSLTLTGHPHFYTNYENLMLFSNSPSVQSFWFVGLVLGTWRADEWHGERNLEKKAAGLHGGNYDPSGRTALPRTFTLRDYDLSKDNLTLHLTPREGGRLPLQLSITIRLLYCATIVWDQLSSFWKITSEGRGVEFGY